MNKYQNTVQYCITELQVLFLDPDMGVYYETLGTQLNTAVSHRNLTGGCAGHEYRKSQLINRFQYMYTVS